MKRNTLVKLAAAVLGVGAFAFIPAVAHAGPVEDARFDVQDAHAQLDAAEARVHDVAAAQAQTQADLGAARQHVADLANGVNFENQNAANAHAHADAVRAGVPGLQDAVRNCASGAEAQRRVDVDRSNLESIRTAFKTEFEARPQFREAQGDLDAAKASADDATNTAVRRATETREYHHAFDEQQELTRVVADLESRRGYDRREVDSAKLRLNAARQHCEDLIARGVEGDPAVQAARGRVTWAQGRIEDLHVRFEQRLAERPDYAAVSADLVVATNAASAGNFRERQAAAQAALDHALADAAGADDAARAAQDRASSLSAQFQSARTDIAALEVRNAQVGADLDAARGARDQAADILHRREVALADLTHPGVGINIGGVDVGIDLPVVIVGERHDGDWERRHRDDHHDDRHDDRDGRHDRD